MKTSTIGNIVTVAIAGVSIGLCIAFPTPLAIFPIVATGSCAIVGTQVLTMKGRQPREYENSINKELIKLENTQSAEYVQQKEYQKLHSNSQKATFKGQHKKYTGILEEDKDSELGL